MKLSIMAFIFLAFSHPLFAQDKSSEIVCEPYYEKGRIKGFTCPEMHEESLLNKMGILHSDVIVGYNNFPIVSYKSMQRFYEQLHKKGLTSVRIMRDGVLYGVKNTNK